MNDVLTDRDAIAITEDLNRENIVTINGVKYVVVAHSKPNEEGQIHAILELEKKLRPF